MPRPDVSKPSSPSLDAAATHTRRSTSSIETWERPVRSASFASCDGSTDTRSCPPSNRNQSSFVVLASACLRHGPRVAGSASTTRHTASICSLLSCCASGFNFDGLKPYVRRSFTVKSAHDIGHADGAHANKRMSVTRRHLFMVILREVCGDIVLHA